jgi:hypothetical protein
MVPVSSDTASVETEFDLDVRLQAVARHVSIDLAMKPSEGCPAGSDQITCDPQGGCME